MTFFLSRTAQSYVSTEGSCVTPYDPHAVAPSWSVHMSHVWMCKSSRTIGQNKAGVRVQIVEYSRKSDVSGLGLLSLHLLTGAEQNSFPSLDLSLL